MSDRNAYIASVAAYAPQRVVTNAFFNDLLGEDVDTWLSNNVQIYERRWCAPDESVADLCEHAARLALERAGIRADELDLIILATDTPEFVSPSTAAVLQHRLGARRAGTFDVNAACAGFVTALDIAAKYIQADPRYNKILVIGGYAMSKYLNLEDKKTVTLFADGAGAAVLCAGEDKGRGLSVQRVAQQRRILRLDGHIRRRDAHACNGGTDCQPRASIAVCQKISQRTQSGNVVGYGFRTMPQSRRKAAGRATLFYHSDQYQRYLGDDGSPCNAPRTGRYGNASFRIHRLGLYSDGV